MAAEGEHTHWEGIWSAGLPKGSKFDCGRCEPSLQALLDGSFGGHECPLPPKGSAALVPGCGRGYAVAALANAGFQTTGMELSETAAAAARQYLASEASAPRSGDIFPRLRPVTASVTVGDFFACEAAGAYSLVFDSTFLCAIPPAWRDRWAAQMAKLIKPGGQIVLNVFPIGDHEGGPPYALTPEIVDALLSGVGFEKIACDDTPEELVARNFKGKEALARYRKK